MGFNAPTVPGAPDYPMEPQPVAPAPAPVTQTPAQQNSEWLQTLPDELLAQYLATPPGGIEPQFWLYVNDEVKRRAAVPKPATATTTALPGVLAGWDATKWANPEHKTTKYEVGRILAKYQPTQEGMMSAWEEIKAKYPGVTFNGRDKIKGLPGTMGEVDVRTNAAVGSTGGPSTWWWGDLTGIEADRQRAGAPATPPGTPPAGTPTPDGTTPPAGPTPTPPPDAPPEELYPPADPDVQNPFLAGADPSLLDLAQVGKGKGGQGLEAAFDGGVAPPPTLGLFGAPVEEPVAPAPPRRRGGLSLMDLANVIKQY